jgi:glycine cleavage system aminomethyltransferase T
MGMGQRSLEDQLSSVGNTVEMLRNAQVGPNVYPGVPAEYSNWRDEQRAWQETCVLFNQSFHMAELMVEGPDTLKLIQYLATNSFENFQPGKAKQFAPCTPYGYVIGDVILFGLEDDKVNLVGRAPALNWVIFHAETGDWNVETTFDQRTALRNDGKRRHYRFQVQGPNAMQVLEKALGSTPPELKFFNLTNVRFAGKDVGALRHGMSGQPGWELFGPWEDHDAVHEALVQAGEEFGMKLVGGRAYGSNALESAWIPSPLPAVYTGDELKAYREWAPATGYEANASLGGSFLSNNIEDYYTTPWDLGYGHLVKFDHDFVGREALERKAEEGNHRVKVTLALEDDDVTNVFHSFLQKDASARAKYFEWPNSVYCMHPFDAVTSDGETVGLSTWIGYSANEGKMLTLAIMNADYAEPGTRVTLLWGEENGGTSKPTVEPHSQTEIGAIVSPAPYVEAARAAYAPGSWRAGARA